MNTSKVCYVTGASQGLGLILEKKLLQNGYRVAAGSHDVHTLSQAVGLILI
jgi:NAD(P)-dependent dehydrogenase (short-subunit alcohol dehydrogenase family)